MIIKKFKIILLQIKKNVYMHKNSLLSCPNDISLLALRINQLLKFISWDYKLSTIQIIYNPLKYKKDESMTHLFIILILILNVLAGYVYLQYFLHLLVLLYPHAFQKVLQIAHALVLQYLHIEIILIQHFFLFLLYLIV